MPEPTVVFDRVWKKFRRGERHDSLRDLIPGTVARLFRAAPPAGALQAQEFWALRDVSFEVRPGEALGIIGPNGAGKSTSLKLLTRILRPTVGQCRLRGRVGALIEVAAGFHGDLTGRENIFLQGAVMGMKRAEIQRHLEEIVEFAGVGAFIDTQVKRYSSGMNARLGFSIAAHLDPDVLIIDEVLAVGDMTFQERCVRRMEEFKRQGVTIVFVSHNLQAVSALCDRALFLQGECLHLGPVEDTLRAYVSSSMAVPEHRRPGSGVELVEARLLHGTETPDAVQPGQPLRLDVRAVVHEPTPDLTFGLMVYRSSDNLIVYEGNRSDVQLGITAGERGQVIELAFDFNAHLTRGQYHLECYVLHNPTHAYLSRLGPVGMFTVQEDVACRGIADIGLHARAEIRGAAGAAAGAPGTRIAPAAAALIR
jgi:lipopolysaccharide transport system ATP-binding protein